MKMSFYSLALLLSIGSSLVAGYEYSNGQVIVGYSPQSYVPRHMQGGGDFSTAKAIGAVGGGLLGLAALGKAEDSVIAKRLADATGSKEKDISNILGLSLAFGVGSYLIGNKDVSSELWKWAFRIPVMAGVYGLATSRTTANILGSMKFIGDRFKCTNAKCAGVCNECRITKGVVGIGFYLAVRPGFDLFNNLTGSNI